MRKKLQKPLSEAAIKAALARFDRVVEEAQDVARYNGATEEEIAEIAAKDVPGRAAYEARLRGVKCDGSADV